MKNRLWSWMMALAGLVAFAISLLGSGAADAQGRTCGGIANLQCPSGQMCVVSGPNFPDRAGVCRPVGRPQVCPHIFQPVCGVNGMTYSNACVAASRGVAVAHPGACTPPPRPYPQPPRVCTDIYQPVCGRDGQTYPNGCVARSNGVRVRHAGQCRPPHGYAPPAYGAPPAPVPYGSYPPQPTYSRPYGERG